MEGRIGASASKKTKMGEGSGAVVEKHTGGGGGSRGGGWTGGDGGSAGAGWTGGCGGSLVAGWSGAGGGSRGPAEQMPWTGGVNPSVQAIIDNLAKEDDPVAKKHELDHFYDDLFDDDGEEETEYTSGEDLDDANYWTFIEKEEEKIRMNGVRYYYDYRFGKFQCPYCPGKSKPKDGFFEAMLGHARDVSTSRKEPEKSRARHATLLDVLTPKPDLFDPDVVEQEYEHISAEELEDYEVEEVEEKKIRQGGVGYIYNFKDSKFQCPYCPGKGKPRDGLYESMLEHARDASQSRMESEKSKAKHATLLAVLTPKP